MHAIRLAGEQDIPLLVALDTIAATDGRRRESIVEWVDENQCHVAFDGGQADGYLVLTRGFFHSPFIEMVMVAEPLRRRGIGRALVLHAIEIAPRGEKLWTSTNASNVPMRALLAQLGFIQSGVIENLDPGDPEIVFLRNPRGNGPDQ